MWVVAIEHVTLDGVMQAPGRADEDTSGGFEHGGWAVAGDRAADPDIGAAMAARMAERRPAARSAHLRRPASVLERPGRTVQGRAQRSREVRVSRSRTDPLPWPNSILIGANVVEEIRRLRRHPGRELHILGSGKLLETLLANDLVDELLLVIHPITLGAGRRLFPDGIPTAFDLVDAHPSATGALIATYRTRST